MSDNQTHWGVFVYTERYCATGTVRVEEIVPAPSLEQAQKWALQWASIPSELYGNDDYVETTVIEIDSKN